MRSIDATRRLDYARLGDQTAYVVGHFDDRSLRVHGRRIKAPRFWHNIAFTTAGRDYPDIFI